MYRSLPFFTTGRLILRRVLSHHCDVVGARYSIFVGAKTQDGKMLNDDNNPQQTEQRQLDTQKQHVEKLTQKRQKIRGSSTRLLNQIDVELRKEGRFGYRLFLRDVGWFISKSIQFV